jgi:hypothetical protein
LRRKVAGSQNQSLRLSGREEFLIRVGIRTPDRIFGIELIVRGLIIVLELLLTTCCKGGLRGKFAKLQKATLFMSLSQLGKTLLHRMDFHGI